MKTHEELMQMKAAAIAAREDAKALTVKADEADRVQLDANKKASDLYAAFSAAVSEIYFTDPPV